MPRGGGSNRLKLIAREFLWVVGIDPGQETGFAVYSLKQRNFEALMSISFWQVFDELDAYPIHQTKVVVEVPTTNRVFHQPAKGLGPLQRQSVNVGRVLREAELMAEGVARLGFTTIKSNPIGKADKKRFQQITGFMGRLNQHQRDAGLLCWGGRPTGF